MTNVVVSLSADIQEIQARKFGSVTTLDTDYALIAGAATLTGLDPSGADWCWVFTEHGINGRIRYCAVPNVASVAYADLVDVDPGSLLSTVEPAGPAWVADLADKVDKGDLVLAAKDYGAVGDGSTNDTAAINAAIAAATSGTRVQLEPGKTYLINGYLSFAGKSDVTFDGAGSTIVMAATGSLYQAFRLSGTCTGVHITNVRVVGVGDVNNQQAGVLINDSASNIITDCSVTNSRFKDLTLGVSVSLTSSGGTLNGWLVEGCHIENIVGTASGYGYGIHVSAGTQSYSAGVRILGNHIKGAQRHAIYHANGEGSVIASNTIRDHRAGVATAEIRPAINVTRSRDVNVIGNNVDGFSDGALIVASESGALDGCVVTGNVFTRPGNAVPAVVIGDQNPPGTPTRNVVFAANVVRSTVAGNLLRINTGTNVLVSGNLFSLIGAAASIVQIYANGDTGGTANYNDYIVVRDNLIVAEGGGTSYAFRFSGVETSTAHVTVTGNIVAGATLSIANSSITNPNLAVS